MTPPVILACILGYFALLLGIGYVTSRRSDSNSAYFLANRSSPWIAVAFGMLGDSLSGVTFISVPGQVGREQFSYFQTVLGYMMGYMVVAHVLLPLYYRYQLTSIYSLLGSRIGTSAQRTGAFFFVISRLGGAAARLFLAAQILHQFVFKAWNIPFAAAVGVIILLILTYTYRGGIKTLVWTDTVQSAFLLGGVVVCLVLLANSLTPSPAGIWRRIEEAGMGQIFFGDWTSPRFFLKQLLGGMFISIVMNGLDQNSMQKSLTCRSLGQAQKNYYLFAAIMGGVNLVFLTAGGVMHLYAQQLGLVMPGTLDHLFPTLALQHLGTLGALAFVLGLSAATFSSADSVLTTLTTSFCVDFLGLDQRSTPDQDRLRRLRHRVHIGFSIVLFLVILGFKLFPSASVIKLVLDLATFTYGPLLGLFSFALVGRRVVYPVLIPVICALSPLLSAGAKYGAPIYLGYTFSFELLLLNGAITFTGLWCISRPGRVDPGSDPIPPYPKPRDPHVAE